MDSNCTHGAMATTSKPVAVVAPMRRCQDGAKQEASATNCRASSGNLTLACSGNLSPSSAPRNPVKYENIDSSQKSPTGAATRLTKDLTSTRHDVTAVPNSRESSVNVETLTLDLNKVSMCKRRTNHEPALNVSPIHSSSLSSPSQSPDVLYAFAGGCDQSGTAVNHCNFYYKNMSNSEAKAKLQRHPVGTFLLRDSSDPRYLYSLSVKTSRGTTSIRIVGYPSGHCRLDSDPHQENRMPMFTSILALVEHYHLSLSETGSRHHRSHCVLLESSGRSDTPMLLKNPLQTSPAPLKHICRLLINNLIPSQKKRQKFISEWANADCRRGQSHQYMFEYPFRI